MQLDVSKAFLTPATPFPFEAEVSLEPQDVVGETITFDTVKIIGTFCMLEEDIRLEGNLQTIAHGTCALCLQEASALVSVDFAEIFSKNAVELEDESFRYNGKNLSLDHMTLTLVMLNLPMRFVCKEDCVGTSELQAWKNDEQMSSCVDGSPTQRPFEALQSLLKKDEEV